MGVDEGFSCLNCSGRACEFETGENPPRCVGGAAAALHDEVRARYAEPENRRIMKAAVVSSSKCGNLTRVQETIEFARLVGARKIGIATCTMLIGESRILGGLLEQAGFEVYGVACKVEGNHRSDLDLVLEDGVEGPVLCNPVMQARLLAEAGTDLNVVMGLCVGHDVLFYKYTKAPTTTLVTKDHVTAHNACAGLYGAKTVYKKRLAETIAACRADVVASGEDA